MEKFLLVANWKANKTVEEAKQWTQEFIVQSSEFEVDTDKIEVAIASPNTLLHFLKKSLLPTTNSELITSLAAQDISAYPVGAYTGEVPAKLLAGLGIKYCLVGHSERRKYLHETNVEIEAKIKQAIENNVIPIICAQTIDEIPANIRNHPSDKFMIMYEPFCAISTDGEYHPESPDKIFSVLTDWENKLNLNCRFLYGGSVNANDISELMTNNYELITGLVVGHASLDVSTFSVIIKKCLQSLL